MSVDLWNRTFRRPFLDVRQEIKEIALANLAMVGNAEILDGTDLPAFFDFGEGFYVFTDDDDWLHPQIGRLLSDGHDVQQAAGVVWGSVAFGTTNRTIILRRDPDGFCYTNNYAIAGSFLRQAPENFLAVFEHGGANEVLKRHGARVVKEYWSVTNKNPTSTVYMEQVLKGDFSSPRLIAGVEDYLRRCERIDAEIDPSLEWARPLMREMVRIFYELS